MHTTYQIKYSSNQNVTFPTIFTSEEREESEHFLQTSCPPDQLALCPAMPGQIPIILLFSSLLYIYSIHVYIHIKERRPI